MKSTFKQYFDKSRFLTVKNKAYAKVCLELFDFQTKNDLIENDITSKIIAGQYKKTRALIIAKQSGVIAGIEEVVYLIKNKTNLEAKIIVKDGQIVKVNELIIELFGNPIEILQYERIILNIMQRMSGIATMTHHLITGQGLKTRLASTRKTPWGLMDKKAVAVGGGLTHRLSLTDEILIKDNHIDMLAKKKAISRPESLKQILVFIKNSRITNPFEMEVETEKEAYFLNISYQKINLKAPLIMMLDNFKPETALRTIKTIRQQKNSKPVIFELSGGINVNNIKNYDRIGADVISAGSLTNSVKAFNISLDFS